MSALIWIVSGWIFGTAYFWDILVISPYSTAGDRASTVFLILFEGALLGPLVAICFLLSPPEWFRKL